MSVASLPLFFAILSLTFLTPASSSAQTWTQDGPAARYYTSAIYDGATDQVVVFGGQSSTGPLNDVWTVPGIVAAGQASTTTPYHWVQLFPSGTPPAARYGHGAAYDSSSNRMIVFGGGTSSTSCMNDTWVLDDANSSTGVSTWIQLFPTGTPPPARLNFNTAYDPSTNSLIVFGGSNCAGAYLSDVWILSGANGESGTPTWAQIIPSGGGPSARENSSAVYDSVNKVLTVFGGDAGSGGLSDVWTLINATASTPAWTQLSPTGTAPSARTGQSAVYDIANNRMIIFGGVTTLTGIQPLGETWILTFANGIGGARRGSLRKLQARLLNAASTRRSIVPRSMTWWYLAERAKSRLLHGTTASSS